MTDVYCNSMIVMNLNGIAWVKFLKESGFHFILILFSVLYTIVVQKELIAWNLFNLW